MADLKSEGTLPVLRETLKIVVMGVIRISMFCLRIEVGMGSKSHVFVPDDDTMFLTRVSFTGEKQSKIAPLYGLNSGSKLLMSRSSLMFCTLSLKNLQNVSGSSSFGMSFGKMGSEFLPQRSLVMVYNDFDVVHSLIDEV